MRRVLLVCRVAGPALGAVAFALLDYWFNGDGFGGPLWAGLLVGVCAFLGLPISAVGLFASLARPRTFWSVLIWAPANFLSGAYCFLLVIIAIGGLTEA